MTIYFCPRKKTGPTPYRFLAGCFAKSSNRLACVMDRMEIHSSPGAGTRVRAERPDEARMLEVLASGGATGLAKALGAGMVLPALALLGVSLDDRTSEAR